MRSRTLEIELATGSISLKVEEGERKDFKDSRGAVNVSNKEILGQLRQNIRRQLPQLRMLPRRDHDLILLCGGPSSEFYIDQIKQQVSDGARVMTMNGTHDWAREKGILRHYYCQVDMREESAGFTATPHPGINYFISSSCHPAVFENLRDSHVYLFHCYGMQSRFRALANYYFGATIPFVEGASTVGTRALHLGYILGYRRFHLYGLDSCIMDGRHHAYPQALNDDDSIEAVGFGDKEFLCQGWMVDQAVGFFNMMQASGHLYELEVYGDGLIRNLMEYYIEKAQEAEANKAA